MKNQSSNTTNIEFIDLKGAKNAFYQPIAGKVNLNAGNKNAITEEAKKDETNSAENLTTKSLGAVSQPE
ncbi:MAG: hypothetical protein EOO20_19990, partial [Chryseobacterium sp.]